MRISPWFGVDIVDERLLLVAPASVFLLVVSFAWRGDFAVRLNLNPTRRRDDANTNTNTNNDNTKEKGTKKVEEGGWGGVYEKEEGDNETKSDAKCDSPRVVNR